MKPEDKISKVNKELENKSQSLTEKINSLKEKIENFKKFKDHTILVDVSGSMDSHVDQHKKAYEVVNHVLENFAGCNLWEFSDASRIRKVNSLSYPSGGTAMAEAFDAMKSQNIKQFILITDGQPNDAGAALKSARGLKIDIIYIGPPPAPQFLQDLAGKTGGSFVDVELIKLGSDKGSKELANKVRLMLNAKNS